MPIERNSPIQSVRVTGNGITLSLRIRRDRPQDLEDFLRENDLTDRVDLSQQPAEPLFTTEPETATPLFAA
jgi:hypothetical protein